MNLGKKVLNKKIEHKGDIFHLLTCSPAVLSSLKIQVSRRNLHLPEPEFLASEGMEKELYA